MLRLLIAAQLAGGLAQAPIAPDKAVLSGRVVEQGTQTPIAGATVILLEMFQGPPPNPFSYRPKTTTTDEAGRFQFADVTPGRYRITTQKAGFAASMAAGPGGPVELHAGAAVDTGVIGLARGGVIAGRVVDSAGEPVVDARVMAVRRGPPPGTSAPVAAQLTNRVLPVGPGAQTDDRGEFRLHSLAAGEYRIMATPRPDFGFMAPGASAATTTPATTTIPTFFPSTTDFDSAQAVRVVPGQTEEGIAIRMLSAAAFEVSGVVSDEAGQPVADAMVRLIGQDADAAPSPLMGTAPQARTDANGRFTLSGVTAGAYSLLAIAPTVLAQDRPQGASFSGFSSASGDRAVDSRRNMVFTESRNGTTLQYREEAGTRTPLTISDANVTGLQLIVRRTGR